MVTSLSSKNPPQWGGLFGHLLDNYDTALYGFLAPLMAPLFFPAHDPLIGLILAYSLLPVSVLTRPLGALLFGRYSVMAGPQKALAVSLGGLAVTTGALGCLPSYEVLGVGAPVLLGGIRLLQGFFSAGEKTVASLFFVEAAPPQQRGFLGGLYASASVGGILCASALSCWILGQEAARGIAEGLWRWPFWGGLVMGLIGTYMRWRRSLTESQQMPIVQPSKVPPPVKTLWTHRWTVGRILLVSSFSYVTYSVPFVFMNTFVPQVTDISLAEMMRWNTWLLMGDMLIVPLLGWGADRWSGAKLMAGAALALALTVIPLFELLPGSAGLMVVGVRLWIVLVGLVFLAPLPAWMVAQVNGPGRYMVTGVGKALGAEIFGRSTPAICLALWHATGSPTAPGLYIAALSLLTFLVVRSQD